MGYPNAFSAITNREYVRIRKTIRSFHIISVHYAIVKHLSVLHPTLRLPTLLLYPIHWKDDRTAFPVMSYQALCLFFRQTMLIAPMIHVLSAITRQTN